MANRPIELEFVANVAKYLSEVKKASVSTEDVAEALVAVTENSDDLERKLSRAMRDAAKDAEVLERAIKGIETQTGTTADAAARDMDRIGDSAREAGDGLRRDLDEAGREAGESLRGSLAEGLSSGDLSEVGQEVAGELISGLKGGLGLGVGAVAAVGLLVFNGFKKQAEEFKAQVEGTFNSLWGNVVSGAGDAFGSINAVFNESALVKKEFTRLWEEDPQGMRTLVEQADLLKISAGDIVLARAGDEAAIKRVQAALDDQFSSQQEIKAATQEEREAHEAVETAIRQGDAAMLEAKSTVDAYNSSVANSKSQWVQQRGEIEELTAAINRIPKDVRVRVALNATTSGDAGSRAFIGKFGIR